MATISLDELTRRLARPRPGRVILFTGAGFSDGATNLLDQPVPLAKRFAENLAKELGEPLDLPLTLISDIYNEQKGNPTALLNNIKSTFTIKDIPESQKTVLRYPWKRIYTTNYDDVVEFVHSPDGSRPESFTRDTLPFNLEDQSRQIIHLNGFVGKLDHDAEINDFALTLSSYIDKSLYSSPWAITLRQDFDLADLIIFCGYSLYDTDIINLLGQNPSFQNKTIAIQWAGISATEERFLSRFGTVHKLGNDGFAALVANVLKSGIPAISVDGPENFREIIRPINPPTRQTNDRDVDALLGRGIFDRDLFQASRIVGGREYVVPRHDVSIIVSALRSPGTQIVVHAEMGNGKTLLTEQVMWELLANGIRPFLFERKTDNSNYDVEFFSKLNEPYVLIVEELLSNADIVEVIRSQLSKASMLMTCRSSAFEVKRSDIRHLFAKDVKVVNVNKLHDDDIKSLISVLNAGAYWAKFPGAQSTRSKERIVYRNCGSELASVMLGVVESQVLDGRVRSVFANSDGQSESSRRILILALCLNYIEMRPTFEFLSELLGVDVFSVMRALKEEYVREFFALDGIEVIARSPIMSEYILRNLVPDDRLLDVILTALTSSEKRHWRARRYREFNSKILQFSFLERIIVSKNNKYSRIQDFYDRAGDLGYKNFSPYYWLQYAIASQNFRDYKAAFRFFEEARKISERRADFYTYKVDNAYAQFLLESRMETDDWADFYDAFAEASSLAMQQTYIQSAGMYPYRVASKFSDYVEIRGASFSRGQRKQASEVCLRWLERIDGLAENVRRNKLVRVARESVSGTYDLLDE